MATSNSTARPYPRAAMQFAVDDRETLGNNPMMDQANCVAMAFDQGSGLDSIELKARPGYDAVLSPSAAIVQDVTLSDLYAVPNTYYDLAIGTHELVERFPYGLPIYSFGNSFDRKVQHTQDLRNCIPPYQMERKRLRSFDVRQMLLAASLCSRALSIPKVNGEFVSTLSAYSKEYEIPHQKPHEAVSDAEATRELRNLVIEELPAFEGLVEKLIDPHGARQMIAIADFYMAPTFRRATGAGAQYLSRITEHPDWSTYDLSIDLEHEFGDTEPSAIEYERLAEDRVPNLLRVINTKNPGLIVPADSALMSRLQGPAESARKTEKAQRLRRDPRVIRAVRSGAMKRVRARRPSPWLELQHYDGFMPKPDERTARLFHRAAPEDKFALAQRFADPRYREFAHRVVMDNWPSTLPSRVRKTLHDEAMERLLSPDFPGNTIPKAEVEVELLLPEAGARAKEILLDLRAHLARMRAGRLQ